ncbi:2-hydroxyacid dehydrogenase [Halomonas dongshanensis]|uniref:D-glycerate dehydrogenase n=1 Tax=Halomonas dongshanensis TaxID=2890835 RepID=A0ABT2EC86_9GAMM|nr:D-glycerate dehydrogenase [Halomonas dongshanensis]MCS2609191.1 D-glycerate dehydrogenase [Halomonas dongshanensis]
MKKNIIVAGQLSEAQRQELEPHAHLIDLGKPLNADDAEVKAALADAHGIIGSGFTIDDAFLDAAPKLKAVTLFSVGYDTMDVDALSKRGVLLCNAPDVLTETTADLAFTLIMSSARRVVELAEWVKAGKWQKSPGPELYGSDIHGKTLGMVGLGRIGAAVARRGALGFGMKVRYALSSPKPDLERELGATRCELDELLAESDFVCLTVPLTRKTEKLIGAEQLAQMKDSALLVNISRGKVVDEAALIEALKAGTIRGAGLDVFEQEPLPADSPLLALPNVVALPHIGSATSETRLAMAQRAVDNLTRFLQGQPPISPVNAEALNQQ